MTLALMRDILFVQPTIISGEEDGVPYVADVLITEGRISQIGDLSHLSSSVDSVNATGLVLCPGFIDLHAHSDLYLLTHPSHEPKITQGVTTELVGQDGLSYVPTRSDNELNAIRTQIEGWNGNPSDEDCKTTHKNVGLFEWRTVGDYLDCLEVNKTATNVAMLVPQGNLRLLACGPNDERASELEMRDQRALLRQAMEQGAVGMSSGLTYTPGMYASTSELTALCQELATFPGSFYAPHHRSYGKGALEAYEEMLQIGRDTGAAIHLTHATMNFAENRGRGKDMLSLVDSARADGVDVTLDTYPYLPGCTTLSAMLPSWAQEGGPHMTIERLRSPITVEQIKRDVEEGCDGGHGLPIDWTTIEVSGLGDADMAQRFSGKTIMEIAVIENRNPADMFVRILIDDKLRTSIIMHVGNEENVQCIMQHEVHCGGSDAILHGGKVHPRAWGTFPRFVGHYSRNLELIPLPRMIAHLTTRPARRLGIYPRRGVIRIGSAADLVLFDPKAIRDLATFANPTKQCAGVEWVLVNGSVAVQNGRTTGLRGGEVLRRRKDGSVRGNLL